LSPALLGAGPGRGLVAALAFVTTADAKPTKTTQINATLVGDGCGVTGLECGSGGGGSCVFFVEYWNFAGDTNISPPLGSLAFTGFYEDGNFCAEIGQDFSCFIPLTYFRELTLTLIAGNGDRLVLVENFSSSTRIPLLSLGATRVQGAWNVDPAQSTGRFTRYSGSGAYTLDLESHYTYATFRIALTGSLTFH
jgi:hypothetical protein